MGPSWASDELSLGALRALLAPLGIGLVQVDPNLIVPRMQPWPAAAGIGPEVSEEPHAVPGRCAVTGTPRAARAR